MSTPRGKRSNAAKKRRRNRYYTPEPPELNEPRWEVGRVDERCEVCETAGRLTADGRPRVIGGSWRGASRRVPPSRRTGGCEVCEGTGRRSLPDDERRDPYNDAAGAQARIQRQRENDEHEAA